MAEYEHRRSRRFHKYRQGIAHWRQHHEGVRHSHRRPRTATVERRHATRRRTAMRVGIIGGSVAAVFLLFVLIGSAWRALSDARSDLLTAQNGLTATRTRQVAAQFDCLIAGANVERAMGRQ